MRILNYDETERIAECSLQRGSRIFDIEIHDIEYVKKYDVYREEFDIELIDFVAKEYDVDTLIPTTLTESEIYDFKRGLLEYIDFESESDMFDGGDRDGSCY